MLLMDCMHSMDGGIQCRSKIDAAIVRVVHVIDGLHAFMSERVTDGLFL